MRISDWSSDVCSSDLPVGFRTDRGAAMPGTRTGIMDRHRIGLVLDHEARAAAARVPNLDHPLRVAQAQAVQRVLRSAPRSEERRVGKWGASPCGIRWSPYP